MNELNNLIEQYDELYRDMQEWFIDGLSISWGEIADREMELKELREKIKALGGEVGE